MRTVSGIVGVALTTVLAMGTAPALASSARAPAPSGAAVLGAASFPGPVGLAVQAAAVPTAPPPPPPAVRYRWPIDGAPTVTRPFQPPPERWLPGHRGVDLAGTPGMVVRASGAGVVDFAGMVAGRGVVSINHPGGLRTTYEPLTPSVVAGQAVAVGDPIGVLVAGHAGCAGPVCLHWGLRSGDMYLNPLSLLGIARVRLLPLISP